MKQTITRIMKRITERITTLARMLFNVLNPPLKAGQTGHIRINGHYIKIIREL